MRDFNFFEPFAEPGRGSGGGDNKIVITIVAVTAALIVIAIPAYQQINTMLLKNEIKNQRTFLDEDDSKRKISEIEQKEALASSLREQSAKVEKINDNLNKQDQIGGHIVDTISESLTEDIFMNRLSIEKSGISIDAVSKDKEGVAVFQSNLRRVPYFEEIFVPSISSENDFNNFTVDMTLKGEEDDDEKTDKEGEN